MARRARQRGADPTCDFPAQPTEAAPGSKPAAKVCERTTGAQGMEPMLAVNGRGTMFMGIATDKGLYEQPGELTGTAENALLRSRNDGRKWRRIPLPGGINASEGFPYVDPDTDRLFVTSLGVDVTRCGSPVIYSDDEGESWTEAEGRPGCSPATAGDWPKIFAGPYRGRSAGRGLPQRRLPLQLRPEHPRRRLDRLLALGRRWRPLRVRELPTDRERRLHRRGRAG